MKYYLIVLILISGLLMSCGGSKKIVNTEQTNQTTVAKEEVKGEIVIKRNAPEVETDMMDTPKEEPKKETLVVPNTDVKPNDGIMVDTPIPAKKPLEAFDHASYNDLVATYVSDQGNVNYNGFKKNWSKIANRNKNFRIN